MTNFNDLKARFQNGDNPLEADFSALIDAIAEAGAREPSINVNASDIRSMMSTNSLKKGALYRIPFQTKHVIPNTSVVNTGATEYLLLYALTTSTVSRFVYSESFPQDMICLDVNDVLCEDFATPRDGKITYRKDYTKNLETYYDFRNVRFRRWQVDISSNTDKEWQPSTNYSYNDGVYFDYTFYRCIEAHTSTMNFEIEKWQVCFVSSSSIKIGTYPTYTPFGILFNGGDYEDYLTFGADCAEISIGKYDYYGYNNVVIGNYCKSINIGMNSTDITFGSSCHGINIGVSSNSIVMDANSSYNKLGNYSSGVYCYNSNLNYVGSFCTGLIFVNAHSNKVETSVYNTSLDGAAYCTLRENSDNNIIYLESVCSEIGSFSKYNRIMKYSKYTKIGANCLNNLIIDNSQSCELKDNSSYNTVISSSNISLGINCLSNTFENSSDRNTLGDWSSNNYFNNSSGNTIGKSCSESRFYEQSNNNILGNNVWRAIMYSGQFNIIGNGCSQNVIGNSGQSASSYNILGNGCSLNSWSGNNSYNKLGNGCSSNAFSAGSSYNDLANNCSYNYFITGMLDEISNNNQLGTGCSGNTMRGEHIVLEAGCSNIKLPFGSSCCYFGTCVSNVEFVESQNDLRFEVSGNIGKVFEGTYPNANVNKISPDGSLWYESIDDTGVVTLHKLTQFVEEPEPTGPTLLQTIKIDLGPAPAIADPEWNSVITNLTTPLNNITGTDSGCSVTPSSFSVNGSTGAFPDSGTGYSIPSDIMKSFFYVGANARNITFTGDASRVYDIIIFGGKSTSGTTAPKGTIYTIGGVAKNLECYGNTANTVSFDKVVPDGSGQIVINVAADTTGGNTTGYINAIIVKEYTV